MAFRGDYNWIHRWEGHNGIPYHPGEHLSDPGASGITFDPGADLGHINRDLFEKQYFPLLTEAQRQVVRGAYGLKGRAAVEYLKKNRKVFRTMRITKDQASDRFPLVAAPYWDGVVKRFPNVQEEQTPAAVHTAMLSLCYNRGVWNRGLDELIPLCRVRNWRDVGRVISGMQQNHKLRGIRERRRAEGALILQSIDKYEQWKDIPMSPMQPKPPTEL